jgi:hypothetical protein
LFTIRPLSCAYRNPAKNVGVVRAPHNEHENRHNGLSVGRFPVQAFFAFIVVLGYLTSWKIPYSRDTCEQRGPGRSIVAKDRDDDLVFPDDDDLLQQLSHF